MIRARFTLAREWPTSSLAGTTGQNAPAGGHVAWGWPLPGHPRSLAFGIGPRTRIAPTGCSGVYGWENAVNVMLTLMFWICA
jgi:hypothetical protein